MNRDVYAYTLIDGKKIYMHNMIMESILGRPLAADEVVEHINGDHLDNRRVNLKLVKVSNN